MRRVPLTTSIAAGAVLVATFLPWGTAPVEDGKERSKMMAVDAWNASLEVAGIAVPNWMPAVAAVALAVWTAVDRNAGRTGVAAAVALYGALHGLWAARIPVLGDGGGLLGIGPLIVMVAFVFVMLAIARADPEEAQVREKGDGALDH